MEKNEIKIPAIDYLSEIETTVLELKLRSDYIIRSEHKENWTDNETVEHAMENVRATIKISDGKMYPMLSFLSDHRVSDEAQRYYASVEPAVIACAMITQSMIQILLGNIFIRIKKLRVPTKLFKKEEEAIEWLEEQRAKFNQAHHPKIAS